MFSGKTKSRRFHKLIKILHRCNKLIYILYRPFSSVDHLGCIRPQLTAAAGYGEPPPLSRRLGEVKRSGPPAEQRDRTIGKIFDEEEEVRSDESYQCSQPQTGRTAIHYTTNTGVGVKSSKCTDLSFSFSLFSNLAPLFTE